MRNLIFLFISSIIIVSCGDAERSPALVYMPDMYYPVTYEPYKKATYKYPDYSEASGIPIFENNHEISALLPVEGTVPHLESGLLPYTLPDSNDGYSASKQITESPLSNLDIKYQEGRGEKLYGQLCSACHGPNGDGQGSIVQSGAYSGVPNYADRDITVGSVYHVIMYGRNAMGSYASQINQRDRWYVAEYVMQLKNNK